MLLFLVCYIDFRLNRLSYVLRPYAIESSLMENTKGDPHLVHFPFYLHRLSGNRNSADFQQKSDDSTLVSDDVT